MRASSAKTEGLLVSRASTFSLAYLAEVMPLLWFRVKAIQNLELYDDSIFDSEA